MLLHFSVVVSQQGKYPQELWAQLRHAVQGFCVLLALFLAAMADDGSSHVRVTQQGAWWLSGSAGVRMETENWLLCSLKAANAKSSDLDQEGRVFMNRLSQKDRISFFHLQLRRDPLYNFTLGCTWFHLQKVLLVVKKGRLTFPTH